MTRKSFTKDRDGASRPCEIINADLISYSPPTFQKGNKFNLTVLDDYTRYLQVFVIKSKTDVYFCLDQAFVEFKTMFHPQYHFRYLRCDNGSEFANFSVEKILRNFEIQFQHSEPYHHEHVNTIKRLNRTLEEIIRALLFTSGFPSSFWDFSAQCAAFLYNRTPHSAIDFVTPFEKAFNKQPNLENIRIFGSQTYINDEKVPKSYKTRSRANIHYLIRFTHTRGISHMTLRLTKYTHVVL